jgi:hypothetical protein
MIHPIRAIQTLACGRSFWQVILTTGKTYSELDMVQDTLGKRRLDWYRDIVATGDTRRIAELWLFAPSGEVALQIKEPNSAYILNTTILNNLSGRDGVAQSIGRVDDKDTGLGIAYTWDCPMQQMYKSEHACVKGFAAWRPGICDPGALNVEAMGVTL